MTNDDLSDWCPKCGPGTPHTAHGRCAHCGVKLILRSVLQKLYDQAAHEFAVAVRSVKWHNTEDMIATLRATNAVADRMERGGLGGQDGSAK